MDFELTASMMCANYGNLEKEVRDLEDGGIDSFHIDIMDGRYVPNFAMSLNDMSFIASATKKPLDVHLMINNPELYVTQFAEAGANIITFHLEATDKVEETISLIKKCGKKVGISVKPNTPIDSLLPYKGLFDMVLIMSVEPGFGGQKFIDSSVEKIRRARELFPDVLIEVDGGINKDTAKLVIEAGVDIIVAGNAVVFADNRKEAIAELRKA